MIMGATRSTTLVGALFALTTCVLFAAGCGSSSQPKTTPSVAFPTAASIPTSASVPTSVVPTMPTYAKCADLFIPGQVIDDAQAIKGCADPDGTIVVGGWRRCDDGRHLINVDASSGAPAGWGFGGDVYHAITGSLDADTAWGAAYNTCTGTQPLPTTS